MYLSALPLLRTGLATEPTRVISRTVASPSPVAVPVAKPAVTFAQRFASRLPPRRTTFAQRLASRLPRRASPFARFNRQVNPLVRPVQSRATQPIPAVLPTGPMVLPTGPVDATVPDFFLDRMSASAAHFGFPTGDEAQARDEKMQEDVPGNEPTNEDEKIAKRKAALKKAAPLIGGLSLLALLF